MGTMSMADLMASQDKKNLKLERNQEVEGEVIHIGDSEIILDLGGKSEGVLSKKDLLDDQLEKLKTGDKLTAFVMRSENESGQVVLGAFKMTSSGRGGGQKNWDKYIAAKNKGQVFKGKALELNKGGLVVEVDGTRAFLPSSQVSLSQAAKMDELVGQDLQVVIIEVDPNQNRLILSQKSNVSEETKKKLSGLKAGDKVKGKVASVLPFGVFATFEEGVEGLAHISELSWEKVEDPNSLFKVGDEVEGVITSVDVNGGRVNFSIKQAGSDPFAELVKDILPEDVVKATVVKISSQGVEVELEGGVPGLIPTGKMDQDLDYPAGKSVTCLVDSIDTQKRRVNLVPFVTSTKDLIYK